MSNGICIWSQNSWITRCSLLPSCVARSNFSLTSVKVGCGSAVEQPDGAPIYGGCFPEMQKERERLEGRNREIDDMFLSLYTDKAKGVISEQRFMKLTAAMEQEQEKNQRRLQELMRMIQQSDAQESEVCVFIRGIRQYATIQELDETVLNRLISWILVGEVKKINGQKTQEVRIVYNFVGEIAK